MGEDYFDLDDESPEIKDDLAAKYNAVFGADLEVLYDILISFCHFGCYLNPEDKAEVGQHNVGVAILSRMGVFSTTADKAELMNNILNTATQRSRR